MSDPSTPTSPDRHRLTFCPDCGTAGGGRDTCPNCARTLLSSSRLAAALAESVAVRAAGRLGNGYRWVRADRRRFTVARAGAALGLLLVVSGTSFAAGGAVAGEEHGDGHVSISAEHHGDGQDQDEN